MSKIKRIVILIVSACILLFIGVKIEHKEEEFSPAQNPPVISQPTPTPPTNTPPVTVIKHCIVGGCSSELCTDASQGPAVSNCMYTASYACYKTAKCEQQQTGECGWTQTPELTQCLNAAKSANNSPHEIQ